MTLFIHHTTPWPTFLSFFHALYSPSVFFISCHSFASLIQKLAYNTPWKNIWSWSHGLTLFVSVIDLFTHLDTTSRSPFITHSTASPLLHLYIIYGVISTESFVFLDLEWSRNLSCDESLEVFPPLVVERSLNVLVSLSLLQLSKVNMFVLGAVL